MQGALREQLAEKDAVIQRLEAKSEAQVGEMAATMKVCDAEYFSTVRVSNQVRIKVRVRIWNLRFVSGSYARFDVLYA